MIILLFVLLKSKELRVKSLLFKLIIFKQTIHDLQITIHNPYEERGSLRSLRRFAPQDDLFGSFFYE